MMHILKVLYYQALRDANYLTHFVPVLQFEYINVQELISYLNNAENFSGYMMFY